MAKLSKTQEWLIVVIAGLFLLAGIGVTYWYLTKDNNKNTEVTQTQKSNEEENDLGSIQADLNEVNELNLSDLEAVQNDLDSVEL